jgi:hypothetical protein
MPLDATTWPPEPQLHLARPGEPELAGTPGMRGSVASMPGDRRAAVRDTIVAPLTAGAPLPPIPAPGAADIGGNVPWTYWRDAAGNAHATFQGLLTLPGLSQQPAGGDPTVIGGGAGAHLTTDLWMDPKADGTPARIYFGPTTGAANPTYNSIGFAGPNGAGLAACDVALASNNGIGFQNTTPSPQRVPIGLNGVQIGARTGAIVANGTVWGNSTNLNDTHRLGLFRFVRNAAQEVQIQVLGNVGWPAITDAGGAPGAGASGGTGFKVNDRLYDQYSNTYTVMAVGAGGAITQLRMDQSVYVIGAVATPVPLIPVAAAGTTGSGASVNLTVTVPNLTTLNSVGDIKMTPAGNFYAIFRAQTGGPTTAMLPAGYWGMWKDGTTVKLYANDGGTIRSVALA